MLVDLDYFYAQAEERRYPTIKDRPVVVCVYSGRSSDSGVVSTANYIARKYGVKSGIPIALAKKKLQGIEATFLPVDHDYYKQTSDNVMAILRRYADDFEQEGIDEAYLDVSQRSGGDYGVTRSLAEDLRREVKEGEGLTCSVGVGPNKLISKIAADIRKPDGLTVVKPEEVVSFLYPLPVDRLPGVGRKIHEKLAELGLMTIGELFRYSSKELIKTFGASLGTYLHNASAGMDEEPVHERGEAESISKIATLKDDTRDLKVIVERADALCEEVHSRLLRRGLKFKSVGVVAIMKDLTIQTRSKTLNEPSDDLEVLKETACFLFERLLAESSSKKIRRVGVRLSSLSAEGIWQRKLTSFFG